MIWQLHDLHCSLHCSYHGPTIHVHTQTKQNVHSNMLWHKWYPPKLWIKSLNTLNKPIWSRGHCIVQISEIRKGKTFLARWKFLIILFYQLLLTAIMFLLFKDQLQLHQIIQILIILHVTLSSHMEEIRLFYKEHDFLKRAIVSVSLLLSANCYSSSLDML